MVGTPHHLADEGCSTKSRRFEEDLLTNDDIFFIVGTRGFDPAVIRAEVHGMRCVRLIESLIEAMRHRCADRRNAFVKLVRMGGFNDPKLISRNPKSFEVLCTFWLSLGCEAIKKSY